MKKSLVKSLIFLGLVQYSIVGLASDYSNDFESDSDASHTQSSSLNETSENEQLNIDKSATAASPTYELTCRAKAKELAIETYRDCVTESKNAEIDKIRNEYQSRLQALKDDYRNEIEKLSGQKNKSKPNLNDKNKKRPQQNLNETFNNTKKKKHNKKTDVVANSEMKLEVKVAGPNKSSNSDSEMEIPEPIPVESINK